MKHLIEDIIPNFAIRSIPLLMGILNVTPDSFSDSSRFLARDAALQHALTLIKEGADIIDIGGESSRPGSQPILLQMEIERVIPVIAGIRKHSQIPLSLDTTKAEVAEAGIKEGVRIINDISALRFDDKMADVLCRYQDVAIILMHMQGKPQTMQENPHYENVVKEILDFFEERIQFCISKGINRNRIILDPGVGFGKRLGDNLKILRNLDQFAGFELPLLVGASRKGFINMIDKSEVHERLGGTLAVTALSYLHNIQIVRVHDLQPNKQFLLVLNAISKS
jgi:dihydropteroate synthase